MLRDSICIGFKSDSNHAFVSGWTRDLSDLIDKMETELNRNLIELSLGFHGLPLIKTWNEEKGANSLARIGIQTNNIDTTVYHNRLKILNFTDRTKRLRLHRFICDKSDSLFKDFRDNPSDRRIKKLISSVGKLRRSFVEVRKW